jgi:hypothetical protein
MDRKITQKHAATARRDRERASRQASRMGAAWGVLAFTHRRGCSNGGAYRANSLHDTFDAANEECKVLQLQLDCERRSGSDLLYAVAMVAPIIDNASNVRGVNYRFIVRGDDAETRRIELRPEAEADSEGAAEGHAQLAARPPPPPAASAAAPLAPAAGAKQMGHRSAAEKAQMRADKKAEYRRQRKAAQQRASGPSPEHL